MGDVIYDCLCSCCVILLLRRYVVVDVTDYGDVVVDRCYAVIRLLLLERCGVVRYHSFVDSVQLLLFLLLLLLLLFMLLFTVFIDVVVIVTLLLLIVVTLLCCYVVVVHCYCCIHCYD
jgi:hypothetical protein